MSYTKYHEAWSASDDLTGAAWNHIETQWDCVKADADAHNHDTRYYTKTLSDATFFTTTFYTGFDADKVDGNHFSDLVAAIMPIGAIMIWSGTDANVPTNWAICNGGSGTPDLRNLFIMGAGDTYAQGATGGAFSTAISGSFTVNAHTITNDEMPLHTHGYVDYSNGVASNWAGALRASCAGGETSRTPNTDAAGGGGGHDHTGNSITLNNLTCTPKYYSLYYIMKVT